MHNRDARGVWVAVVACVLALAGCGTAGSDGSFAGGQNDGGGALDATSPGNLLGDATVGGADAASSCTPTTCALAGANCGPIADGCGGQVDCGDSCPAPGTCGGGGTPSVCGGTAQCVPATCTTLSVSCGKQGDGCGNIIDCGTCAAPQTCGGGGTPSVCGGTAGCVPLTACSSTAMNCGAQADGCGGLIMCGGGAACPAGMTCGGGGQSNVCGAADILPDGGIIDGGLNVCVPIPMATACAGKCGPETDGCTSYYECGGCTSPATCGGGGPSICGGDAGCVGLASCPATMSCGFIADGCGNAIACGVDGGTCPAGQLCGGGGTPNVCGAKNVLSDGGTIDGGLNVCVPIPQTTACMGIGCGQTGDGCGNLYTCGTCSGSDTCGGAGTPFQCGHPSCVPITTCPSSVQCGTVANGCGGTITCAACPSLETCGGGGTPYQCGQPPCVPLITCPTGVNCGPWANGCGGTIATCGTCTSPESCGGGGTASKCGEPACVPLTKCPSPANCGTWPNGCDGGTISCGTCAFPEICGGSGVPSECGGGLADGGAACSGINCNLRACDAGATTAITGHVYDPAGNNGIYNVVVYVPQSLPSKLSHGPSCDTCGSLYSGDPLVATTTDATGFFTLSNVPVMADLPIVLQIGKWRRQMFLPTAVTACTTNAIPDGAFKLPSKENLQPAGVDGGPWEGPGTIDDIPEIAISTGGADTLECLLTRIGVDESEYAPGGVDGGTAQGHIHIFQGSATGGGTAPTMTGSPKSYDGLWSSYDELAEYDIVILSCEGAETKGASGALTSTELGNLYEYANNGGRVFASHFHYAWFNKTEAGGSFGADNLATWHTGANAITDLAGSAEINANVVQTLWDGGAFPRGEALFTFLQTTNALGGAANKIGPDSGTGPNELNIQSPKHNADVAVTNTPSQPWLVGDTNASVPNATEYFSFDTPVGGETTDAGLTYCGRVVFSDLHVGSAVKPPDYSDGGSTPSACTSSTLSPQEKALEFMLFDLSSCVSSDSNLPTPPSCKPLTACPALTDGGARCGTYPDGCGTGGVVTCAACPSGDTCVNGSCVGCVPLKACPALADGGPMCGEWPDGCGGVLTCNGCPTGEACVNGSCTTGCNPETCASQSLTCGQAGDGCGGTIDGGCGTCGAGAACISGKCATDTCTPLSCAALGLSCGPAGNGCDGGTQDCGDCTTPGQTCGGGGKPGVCGQGDANACTPLGCGSVTCGYSGDGCGNLVFCGKCTAPATCGGGGTPGVCGSPTCTPLTCGSITCGYIGDGCGNLLDCGNCPPPESCGGAGTPGVCGQGDSSACSPMGCGTLQCGETGDGCGNILMCGTCTPPESCGGGGHPGMCGAPSCTPSTCTNLGATCGQVADGCGGLTVSCGTCTGSATCGGGGTANECGTPNCTPRTCALAGANCGPVADGCGGIVQCGACMAPDTCGGGGIGSVCGTGGIK